MKQLVTMWCLVFPLIVGAQSPGFCPDSDADGFIGVGDVLSVLSVFGQDFTCASNDYYLDNDSVFAILFIESSLDAQLIGSADSDIATYMLEGAPFMEWFGWTLGGQPNLSNPHVLADFLYWMDWPGFDSGTVNAPPAQFVPIPQEGATGLDAFENPIEQYKFVTAKFENFSSTGSILQFVAITPLVMTNGSSLSYTSIGFDFLGSPLGATYQTTGVNANSTVDLTYEGNQWPTTTYRVHTNSGALSHNVFGDTGPMFFRGGNFTIV